MRFFDEMSVDTMFVEMSIEDMSGGEMSVDIDVGRLDVCRCKDMLQ
jgi:hypothetical protein